MGSENNSALSPDTSIDAIESNKVAVVGNESPFCRVTHHLISHIVLTVLAIILTIIGIEIDNHVEPYHAYFVERDPSLSYPFMKPAISDGTLIVISLVIPFVIILALQLSTKFLKYEHEQKLLDFFVSQAGLIQSFGITFFLSNALKLIFGRKRPNFFAYCDYKGFRTAMSTGNFTDYNSQTIPGNPGSEMYCSADLGDLLDSQFSFPSSHSSLSFAGLGYLSYFIHMLFFTHRTKKDWFHLKTIVFIFPLFSAVVVCATRTRDYYHNFDDILAGAVLGFLIASFIFYINYSKEHSKREHDNE